MHGFEIDTALKTLTVLVDTREQPTPRLKKRIKDMGIPAVRRKLDFGDYSAKVTLSDGSEYSLEKAVCVERKMDIDELCGCFCKGRARFTREFERTKEAGAKIYLLVEGASWEKIYRHNYMSLMTPNALVASITAWLARYDCVLLFCQTETSGRLIKEILYREIKERLSTIGDDDTCSKADS